VADLRAYALAKPGAWLDQPWEGDHVAKVHDKIFVFLGEESIGVKCAHTREEADEWLARYPRDASVMPYIGRSGWNTLRRGGAIPEEELCEALDLSYDLIVAKLAKKHRP
jgi:predicted DNA-binding protein (MmcQ/YjbR family)